MSKTLLSASNISVERSGSQLLNAVDIDVKAGELVGLIGPNGAGKSTLLSVLAGLDTPNTGAVQWLDAPLSQLSDRQRAQQIGWMEQLSAPHWPVSVEHLVMLGRLPYLTRWQSPTESDHANVEAALEATDCVALRERRVNTLSGGELTRVMLARVLATEPQLLFADEPIAALDIGHQLQTLDVLRAFATSERGCLVVLHDLSLASRYCDRLVLLNDGRCVASGVAKDVLTEQIVRDVYGVEVMAIGPEGSVLYPINLSGS